MNNLPKHLREMTPENVARLQRGFNRFRFGFAEVGETLELQCSGDYEGKKIKLTFLGDFKLMREAEATAAQHHGKVNPYLYGHQARGWAVWSSSEPY